MLHCGLKCSIGYNLVNRLLFRVPRELSPGCLMIFSAEQSPARSDEPQEVRALGPLRVHPDNPRYFTDGIVNRYAEVGTVAPSAERRAPSDGRWAMGDGRWAIRFAGRSG
jgi:hypothetical protein